MPQPRIILVTGATGYIGGRLVQRLLDQGTKFVGWRVNRIDNTLTLAPEASVRSVQVSGLH